ncbi:3-hydroxybutyrate dehydrogenase [Euryhalocaulis caribicus]|uniref:3-hydroxybutyrate dehydrogenase n=1 Tax=Euryhalocaulis caribicus TaxID=1161401 RepID=UPI00039A38CA|nr:3-hydroxybutyrate dehydrogenase [Euryhalocaulis caribicus]
MSASRSLDGQTALITGSTSGIGLQFAKGLAESGANIVLNGLGDEAEIEKTRAELASECGVEVRYHPANMLEPDEIAYMVAFAKSEFGRLDILVCNAGIQHVEKIEDFPKEKWDAIIAINLSSAFHAIKHAMPVMKAQGRGRIVNLASVHGLISSPFKSAYVAAKHGMVGLTKTVAQEGGEFGVTCNAICPGYVKTPLVEAQIPDQAKSRGISEEEVVEKVFLADTFTKKFTDYDQLVGLLRYLVSDAGASTTGVAIPVDGGWLTH